MRGPNPIADQLQTTMTFDESSQHFDITSSVNIALSTCQAEAEVVRCIVTNAVDDSTVERGDTICQPCE